MSIERDCFRSLSENKIEFVRRLSIDEQLAKAILCKDKNFLDYELPSDYQSLLPFKNIYPTRYTVDTKENVESYITMSFYYEASIKSNIWKTGRITFFIFCHKTLIQTDYGCLRYDFILNRVSELLLDTRFKTWLGKLEFDDMEDITVDEDGDYNGVRVTFKTVEKS